jgi:hypothetical protein
VTVSLADHVRAALTPDRPKCKTCEILADLSHEDRIEFEELKGRNGIAPAIARGLSSRLKELGDGRTIGEASVRIHIVDEHVLPDRAEG